MKNTPDPQLERLAKTVVRAGGISEDEVDGITSNPFLNARIRARIEAERTRRAQKGSGWFITLLVATRAIAILLLITAAAAVTSFRVSRPASPAAAAPANKADDVSRVVTGGTCALSAIDECAISNDEVLATLFAEEGGTRK